MAKFQAEMESRVEIDFGAAGYHWVDVEVEGEVEIDDQEVLDATLENYDFWGASEVAQLLEDWVGQASRKQIDELVGSLSDEVKEDLNIMPLLEGLGKAAEGGR